MSAAEGVKGPRFEVALGDEAYPGLLAQIANPPERLYGIGDPLALVPGVAVIGARRATPYGLSCAELVAAHVARRGAIVVSGGARGCDQAAHRAAVENGSPTVVVFGSGADVTYPKSGKSLFQGVVDGGGAIVSENPWGTPPMRGLFPRRNRIIAGLSMLLVIAEAGLPSGTFSTADAALEYGRIVGTVPGSILSPNSKGSNHLLSQGATAILDTETLDTALSLAFTSLPLSLRPPDGAPGCIDVVMRGVQHDPLLRALAADAYTPGELTSYFGFSRAELAQRLAQLEVQGVVERGRDGRYQVCGHVTGEASVGG